MYIVIEGIDTAGKSTQLNILEQNNPNAIFTKEPGGTN
ncbi:MAG: dTMP kinase, partial [Campylobacteraceae bacterium]|nr:dTMP kinase [Campylobacteraceae bacterium]